MNAPLAQMLRYNNWATLTLIAACRPLPDAQLDIREESMSGSVRELLTYIVGGQQTFVLRTKGRQHEGELGRGSAWPGWEVLLAAARRSGEELIAIAGDLVTEREVDLPYPGAAYRFPASFFLVHAVAHGVEHRTEVKLALARHGIATPDLDGWPYATAMGYGGRVSGSGPLPQPLSHKGRGASNAC